MSGQKEKEGGSGGGGNGGFTQLSSSCAATDIVFPREEWRAFRAAHSKNAAATRPRLAAPSERCTRSTVPQRLTPRSAAERIRQLASSAVCVRTLGARDNRALSSLPIPSNKFLLCFGSKMSVYWGGLFKRRYKRNSVIIIGDSTVPAAAFADWRRHARAGERGGRRRRLQPADTCIYCEPSLASKMFLKQIQACACYT